MFNRYAPIPLAETTTNVARAFFLRVGASARLRTKSLMPRPTFYDAGGHGKHGNHCRYAARFFNGAVVQRSCETHHRCDDRITFSTSRGQCSSAVQSDLAPAHTFTCSAGHGARVNHRTYARRTPFQRSAASRNSLPNFKTPRCTFLKLAARRRPKTTPAVPPTSPLYCLLANDGAQPTISPPASHPLSARRTHHEQ